MNMDISNKIFTSLKEAQLLNERASFKDVTSLYSDIMTSVDSAIYKLDTLLKIYPNDSGFKGVSDGLKSLKDLITSASTYSVSVEDAEAPYETPVSAMEEPPVEGPAVPAETPMEEPVAEPTEEPETPEEEIGEGAMGDIDNKRQDLEVEIASLEDELTSATGARAVYVQRKLENAKKELDKITKQIADINAANKPQENVE